ncbi:MAG: TetR/AcrR family transcriptional regulator [Thermomicrobiales bacterium]
MRERIVAAAARLLERHGADAVTTRAVSAEAGVQAPTIYRLFGDKDGLLDAVAQHVFAAYVAGKAMGGQSGDPVADLRAGWETHMGFGLANPALFALLGAARHGAPSHAAVAGTEILRGRVERVAAAGRLRVPVPRAVEMIHAAGAGAVLALLAMPPEDRDPGLGDAVYDALMRSIVTDHAAEQDDDAATSAAITLRSNLPALTALTDAERSLMAEWLQRIIDRDAGAESDR